jgi:hypothetical protein
MVTNTLAFQIKLQPPQQCEHIQIGYSWLTSKGCNKVQPLNSSLVCVVVAGGGQAAGSDKLQRYQIKIQSKSNPGL